MESWRLVWRNGFAPQATDIGLAALRDALRSNSPCLAQGTTTQPPPLLAVTDWPVEAGCGIAFLGWKGNGLTTVGEVEEAFAALCAGADRLLGEPVACRYFINWFDDTPREEMRRELLAEVEYEINRRKGDTVRKLALAGAV